MGGLEEKLRFKLTSPKVKVEVEAELGNMHTTSAKDEVAGFKLISHYLSGRVGGWVAGWLGGRLWRNGK